ncbi:MAG: GYD domain-containing protein, partial [Verrucomicrobia bacterium]|nr:GYD domain-containing protein [Verrucomicrobiota bacterium]
MATYITLIRFTEQGAKNFQKSPNRAAAFEAAAEKVGAKVRVVYWTLGEYDGAIIFDSPDEETATSLMLALGSLGNVHTTTLRAFSAPEMNAIIAKA